MTQPAPVIEDMAELQDSWLARDSLQCWELAVASRRKLGIIERRFDPVTEGERCLWLG